ncbi:hypothetical protein MLD38_028601 [Melastoma candidum]|uniref:Uncharacterized protein n=1 Tax=Melastoma candidum TaxID=119954 RepID=A0ACB9N2T9_9MYRT|nr:hypothetical protein MLD38_028601 [Melastoma candidum]
MTNNRSVLYKQSEVEIGMELKDKMAELVTTKEHINRARETAMRSYQESKPLIARLEKSKASLEKARSRRPTLEGLSSSELRSQLAAIEAALREKKEEEAKASRLMDEMSRAAEDTRGEIDSLKAEIEEERRTRQKLKQVLRIKWQKLRAIQLSLRAVRIESEAIKVSLEYAVQQADLAKTEVGVVHLDQEEYWALQGRAEEEESHAEWRIAASIEQKAAAEESRKLALKRLKNVKEGNHMRRRAVQRVSDKKDSRERTEEEDFNKQQPEVAAYGGRATPISRTRELTEIRNGMRHGRGQGDNKRKVVIKQKKKKKKKQSIFAQIRRFFAKRFSKIFK